MSISNDQKKSKIIVFSCWHENGSGWFEGNHWKIWAQFGLCLFFFFNTLYQAFTKWSSSVKALGMDKLAPNHGQKIYLSFQWNKWMDSLRSRKADTWWILENLFNVWSSVTVIQRHLQSFQRQALQQVGETLEQVVWFNWKGLVLFCILPIFHYDHQLGILHSSLRGINSNIVSLFFSSKERNGIV